MQKARETSTCENAEGDGHMQRCPGHSTPKLPASLTLPQPVHIKINKMNKHKHHGFGIAIPEAPSHTPTADLFPTRGNHPVSRFPEKRAEARIYHANIHETKYKGVSASMSRILRVYGCRCRLLYIACCSLCYGYRQRAVSVCRESRGMEGR